MEEEVFRVALLPINEHTTTDGLLKKLRLVCGGVGLKVVSAEPIDDEDDERVLQSVIK